MNYFSIVKQTCAQGFIPWDHTNYIGVDDQRKHIFPLSRANVCDIVIFPFSYLACQLVMPFCQVFQLLYYCLFIVAFFMSCLLLRIISKKADRTRRDQDHIKYLPKILFRQLNYYFAFQILQPFLCISAEDYINQITVYGKDIK